MSAVKLHNTHSHLADHGNVCLQLEFLGHAATPSSPHRTLPVRYRSHAIATHDLPHSLSTHSINTSIQHILFTNVLVPFYRTLYSTRQSLCLVVQHPREHEWSTNPHQLRPSHPTANGIKTIFIIATNHAIRRNQGGRGVSILPY